MFDSMLDELKEVNYFKGTARQIEKALINDRLRVPEVSWKFRIPTIYHFAVIYPWILIVSIVFSVYKQNFTAH